MKKAADWEEIFAMYLLYKELRSEYLKKSYKSSRKKKQQPHFFGEKKT